MLIIEAGELTLIDPRLSVKFDKPTWQHQLMPDGEMLTVIALKYVCADAVNLNMLILSGLLELEQHASIANEETKTMLEEQIVAYEKYVTLYNFVVRAGLKATIDYINSYPIRHVKLSRTFMDSI